ncbi:hypothetical protein ABZV75_25170 [Streptomyces flaveolus]|uniref:hypothetical protein n=1 Tax=Streptomyces flaveolus TaxID=67297 RepID=UPI00339F9CDF
MGAGVFFRAWVILWARARAAHSSTPFSAASARGCAGLGSGGRDAGAVLGCPGSGGSGATVAGGCGTHGSATEPSNSMNPMNPVNR